MNSTSLIELIKIVTDPTLVTTESWFLPADIILIVVAILTIIFATCFLFVIVLDKTCHTVPMMLIANLCLTTLMFTCGLLSYSIFTLQNDLQQRQYQDSFCIIRAFITYGSGTAMDYSYVLQAVYRYIMIVHPKHLFLQSFRFQTLLICLTWIGGYVFLIPYVSYGEIKYNVDNQICQVPLRLSFSLMFMLLYAYMIPMLLVMLIYLRLFQYVKEMRKRIVPVNTLFRAQKQLQMVRRTVILLTLAITVCFPYAVFVLISFFIAPPKYHLRISYLCVNASVLLVMIAVFQFTEPLKTSSMKKLKRRPNIIVAWIA